jgi:hypothetical protein
VFGLIVGWVIGQYVKEKKISIDFKTKYLSYQKNKRSTYRYHFSYLNPISQIIGYFKHKKWLQTKKWLRENGLESVICQGCGEGIAKYRIIDPNSLSEKTVKYFTTCDDCLSFYDISGSSKKIIKWKVVLEKRGN